MNFCKIILVNFGNFTRVVYPLICLVRGCMRQNLGVRVGSGFGVWGSVWREMYLCLVKCITKLKCSVVVSSVGRNVP